MPSPMISQPKKRSQVMTGRPDMSSTQKKMLRMGTEIPPGSAEATTPLRFAIAQDQHADRYQHKGKEGADIRQVSQRADIQQPTGNGHHKAGNPGSYGRRAKTRVHLAEPAGEKPVARHGEPDPRLAELEDQNGGDHAHHRAAEHDQPDPVERHRARIMAVAS